MDCVVAVNAPGPVQEYDAIPAVATKEVVALEQIVFVPAIVQFGRALIVIVPVAVGFVHGEPVVVTV